MQKSVPPALCNSANGNRKALRVVADAARGWHWKVKFSPLITNTAYMNTYINYNQ